VSNPESTTILDNYTVIALLAGPRPNAQRKITNKEFPALIRSPLTAREIAARVGVASTTILGYADYRIGDIERTGVSGINFNSCRHPHMSQVAPM
jgi:hypothetical protein